MIFVTSISPYHINENSQKEAVESWHKLGVRVYSLNSRNELLKIKSDYPLVTFIETTQTRENLFGKPVVSINALIDFASDCKDNEDGLITIINSDIIIEDNKEKLERFKELSDKGFVFVSRWNYTDSFENSVQEKYGIDMFAFHRRIATVFPDNPVFSMGQCYWDYWLPFHATRNNIKLFYIGEKWCYHKSHRRQWSISNWTICASAFQRENRINIPVLKNMSKKVRSYFMDRKEDVSLIVRG